MMRRCSTPASSISQALIDGLPLTAATERAGHPRPSTTTDIYAHIGWQQHRDVADRLGAIRGGATAGKARNYGNITGTGHMS